mmetsp:Transcript_37989/g.94396  ORF Transcript_37989/g.94396 Transcript_37989/m.94396 type:complete len:304 (+) Transcript_37989:1104-2015(+)
MQVGRARDVERHRLGNGLDDVGASVAGSDHLARLEGGDQLVEVWRLAIDGILESRGLVGVGLLPRVKGLHPFVIFGDERGLVLLEVIIGLRGHIPLVLGEAKRLTCGILELHASLTVGSAGAGDLVDALANDGLAHDEGWLAVAGLGVRVSLGDRLHVVAVNGEDLPALRLEPHGDILGLRVLGHLVESDAVGVVHEDQVVKLLVASEGNSLVRDALLQASIAAQDDDLVVNNGVVSRVERGRRQLGRCGHADTVANALAEGTSGGLDAWGPAELRVAGGLGVLGTEVLDLIHGEIEASHVQP